jgi:lipopolysaccharide transport system ATP-binding protein
MSIAIELHNISKQYRLGTIGTGTLSHDLNRWWAQIRGKEDPYLKIGEENNRSEKGKSDYIWALRDINFQVESGEVLGIIGKNGAGKSTLLKILSRVTSPSTGEIRIKGRIASLLEVGTGFHPELTGRENIFLNGAIMGMTRKEILSKLDEIIDFSGVERYIDTPVKRYSSGMYVRLAFGVAAHLEPEILIVDEVLAVGDAEFQKKCIGKMQDVSQKEGRTVLFVSHNMAAVKALCNSALVLKNGKVDFPKGNTDLAIQHYLKLEDELMAIPLIDRKDRQGKGNVLLSHLEFINSSGQSVGQLISGEAAEIRVHYRNRTGEAGLNNMIGILVERNDGFTVLDLSNVYTGHPYTWNKEKGYISCVLDKLPLSGGNYYIHLILWQNDSLQDWILNAGNLTVEEGDFYGTGQTSTGVKVPHKWNFS